MRFTTLSDRVILSPANRAGGRIARSGRRRGLIGAASGARQRHGGAALAVTLSSAWVLTMEHKKPKSSPMSASPSDESAQAEALWRAARLAALVVAAGRLGHDLRGALSPALLMGERLQSHADPAVRRAADSVVRAIDRASDLVRVMVEYAREMPTGLHREPLALRAAVERAAAEAGVVVANEVDDALWAEADGPSLARALAHLLRNAAAAGAGRIRLSGSAQPGPATVLIEDDGPGLPEPVQRHPFRPAVTGGHPGGRPGGAGLGLATAREILRANGGDLTLEATGPAGTCFRATLPRARRAG